MTFICGERGQPSRRNRRQNEFRLAARRPTCRLSRTWVRKIRHHGGDNETTTSQLKAIFAWTSDAMPAVYTKAADREASPGSWALCS